MKKSFIITLIVIAIIAITSFFIYRIIDKYDVTIELNQKVIKANMYDEIDLRQYIEKAIDSDGKIVTDKIKISANCDEEDVFKNDTLIIKGAGIKEINYTVKKLWKTFKRSLVITVIVDPNDKDFNPNYSSIDENTKNISDEVPINEGDSNLTKEQLEYLNSL